jgi:hypothetical protein
MVELAVELYGQRVGVISGDNYRSFDITVNPSATPDGAERPHFPAFNPKLCSHKLQQGGQGFHLMG